MLSTSITNNSITVVITSATGNKVYTINKTHANYDAVLDAVRNNNEAAIPALCNIATTIENYFEGNVAVRGGQVYYGQILVEGPVVDRVVEFAKNKLPVQPLLRFINKLMANPSSRAVGELYKFLEHKNMPITPDGNFLAYKGVQSDYYSKTAGDIQIIKGKVESGRIFNGISQTIEVVRNQVCDNKDEGCSKGLHAGSLKYATEFAGHGGKVVIVEINPSDVVSIPTDCDCQKLRTCKYNVVGEYEVPLDSNYCKDYCDGGDVDEEYLSSDDDECEDDEAGDAAFCEGYDAGFEDASSGRTPLPNDGRANQSEDEERYLEGYDSGFDDGSDDDEEVDDEDDDMCSYVVGYNEGLLGGICGKFDVSNMFNYNTKEDRSEYEVGYAAGYDDGVINRKPKPTS